MTGEESRTHYVDMSNQELEDTYRERCNEVDESFKKIDETKKTNLFDGDPTVNPIGKNLIAVIELADMCIKVNNNIFKSRKTKQGEQ